MNERMNATECPENISKFWILYSKAFLVYKTFFTLTVEPYKKRLLKEYEWVNECPKNILYIFKHYFRLPCPLLTLSWVLLYLTVKEYRILTEKI